MIPTALEESGALCQQTTERYGVPPPVSGGVRPEYERGTYAGRE